MSTGWRLAIVAIIEVLYMAASRWVQAQFGWSSMEGELIRTALRIATAAAYWGLFRETILSRRPRPSRLRDPLALLALAVLMSVPVLVGNYRFDSQLAMLFALSSVPVAVKEEFLFRGIVQNLLDGRFGTAKAVALTSVVFTAWHVGVLQPTIQTFAEVFLASVFLGVLYACSGSMLAAIGVHAAYDAVYSFTPLLARPLQGNWAFVPLLAAVCAAMLWASRHRAKTWRPRE